MDISKTWNVVVRSRTGEDFSYALPAPDRETAIALARARARTVEPFGLWSWPLVSARPDDWRRRDALSGR